MFRICIYLIRIRIRIQQFRLNTDPDPDPIRIQGFEDQNLEKKFCINNYNFPVLDLIKNRRAEEAFSPQKRISSTSKHEISKFLWVIFAFLIRLRIH